MFRQDRTNSSTAVSNWRGNRSTPKAWPSTATSTWLNGGLFGGAGFNAFGGIITQYEDSGTTYRVHTFRGTSKFEVSSGSADVDYLIVAAGGGAYPSGTDHGSGGGGAGGVLTGTGVTVDADSSPYTITVGLGAPSGGSDGTDSVALGFTAEGGGTGRATSGGQSGGSGGGSGSDAAGGVGNAGPPRQGYNGGVGSKVYIFGYKYGGGGGGGYGGAGGATTGADGYTGGIGGAGATGYGIGTASGHTTPIYAGGGGADGTNESGAGALTGGGGSPYEFPTGGVMATGGGAGWSATGQGCTDGTPGGSGIVIIRYVVA